MLPDAAWQLLLLRSPTPLCPPPPRSCGVEYDVNPFLKRVERGMDPDAAWQEAQPEIDSRATYGTWLRDVYAREPDPSGRWCHMREIQ